MSTTRRSFVAGAAALPAASVALPQSLMASVHLDAELLALDQELAVLRARIEENIAAESRASRQIEADMPQCNREPSDWGHPVWPCDILDALSDPASGAFAALYQEARRQKAVVAKRSVENNAEMAQRRAAYAASDFDFDANQDEFEELCRQAWKVANRIFALPAQTPTGMLVKLRAADRVGVERDHEDHPAHLSIAADIERLAGEATS